MKFTERLLVTFGVFLFLVGFAYMGVVWAFGRTVGIAPVAILFANGIFFIFIAIMIRAAPAMEYMREHPETSVERELPPPVEKERLERQPPPKGVHIPPPSYWPVIITIGAALAALGFIFDITTNALVVAGAVVLIVAGLGWAIEAWKERAEVIAHEEHEEDEAQEETGAGVA